MGQSKLPTFARRSQTPLSPFAKEVSTLIYTRLTSGLVSVVTTIPIWDGILCPEDLCAVRYSCFRPLKRGILLGVHEGSIWDIAASQGGPGAGVHSVVLSVGSDGVCSILSPTNRIFFGSKASPHCAIANIALCSEGAIPRGTRGRGVQIDRGV